MAAGWRTSRYLFLEIYKSRFGKGRKGKKKRLLSVAESLRVKKISQIVDERKRKGE